jgi:hypothetical protein
MLYLKFFPQSGPDIYSYISVVPSWFLVIQNILNLGAENNHNVTFHLQDILREAGCLFRLQNLLLYPKVNVQHAAIKALGNLALNQENQKELKVCVIS